jgi:hypothetical protein
MRTFNWIGVGICVLVGSIASAAERPTLLKTNDPRPDILPRPFYDHHTEYRARYNRPRFVTGLLAYEMSRTSLEAMVWKENYCAGTYDEHHTPPVYKRYNYPKPWEALNVGARPDFARAMPKTQRVPAASEFDLNESVSIRKQPEEANADQDSAADSPTPPSSVIVPPPSDK